MRAERVLSSEEPDYEAGVVEIMSKRQFEGSSLVLDLREYLIEEFDTGEDLHKVSDEVLRRFFDVTSIDDPEAVIIDGGCGSGRHTYQLHQQAPPTFGGKIIGINKDPETFVAFEEIIERDGIDGVSFEEGDITNLWKYNDESVHALKEENVLYYVRSDLAIAESYRVLENNGLYIATTRGPDHLKRFFNDAERVADKLNTALPPPTYGTFPPLTAREKLSKKFTIINEGIENQEQSTLMLIPAAVRHLYGYAIAAQVRGLIRDKNVRMSDILQVVDEEVMTAFDEEIQNEGFYKMPTQQAFFACLKNPSLSDSQLEYLREAIILKH